jgi:hypothetical protein
MSLITFVIPKNVGSNFSGYDLLAKINFETWDTQEKDICLDFLENEWFDPNLCSPLGAIITNLQERKNTVKIINLQESTESLFTRNGFFSLVDTNYVNEKFYTHCIDFSYFNLSDVEPFQKYIDEKLLGVKAIPKMSSALKRVINERIIEIFNNAHEHGRCRHVFACGQLFEGEKKLRFTMADMGVTIRRNVNENFRTGRSLNGVECINWAVEFGNTTKKGSIPGGLGFTIIRTFLRLNQGAFQIISSEGFWEERGNQIFTDFLTNRFLGTIVTFEINLNDQQSYILASEQIDPQTVL